MASVGEKFDAAVSVIKKLPKNGPFQPSYELMKRFYGLYKQATEGPCHQSKPAFWNVVQTQKWQAWSVLGDMASEEAKRLYVEELLQTILDNSKAQDIPHLYKIIETMPQTEDVVTFLKVMGPFFELVHEEEPEKAAASTPQVTKVNGHVNGGVKMKETKVDERGDQAKTLQNGDLSDVSDYTNGHLEGDHYMNGGSRDKTEVTENLDSSEADEKVKGHGKEEKKEEETKESRFVRVETSHVGENSAELSHPILISKSQLEAAAEHQPSASESESDGDEFCDSVDVPLINTLSLAHISKADSLPSVTEEEEERRKQLTSTPFNGDHAVVTRAEVHNNVDAVIEPRYTTSSSTAPTTSTPCMRGGGEVTGGSKGQQGQDSSRGQTGQGHSSSGYQPSDSFQNLRSSGSQDSSFGSGRQGGGVGAGGGGPGRRTPGGDGSPLRSPLPDGVVEQITVSLERLQRDMNSVLVRLNTLETIAISRHQLETQQAYMREGIPLPQDSAPVRPPPRQASSPSWWPFPTLPLRTVFILLVWPFIVQWILRFLARHRRARPPPR